MDDRIVPFLLLSFVPLVATVVLFWLFESYALFTDVKKGIKLGGAVAAYFVLLGSATSMWVVLEPAQVDLIAEVRKNIVGDYRCLGTHEYGESKSSMGISENSLGLLQITGLGENVPEITGIDRPHVFWEANEVVLTETKLVFFWEVPLTGMVGVTTQRFEPGRKTEYLLGHWVISGQAGKGGIECWRELP